MLQKRMRWLVLLAAFAMFVAACGGGEEGGEEETTTTTAAEEETTTTTAAPETTTTTAAPEASAELLIWADDKTAPVLDSLAAQVLEETGVAITTELFNFDDLRTQIVQAAPAGEGPDLFVGRHDWTGEMVAQGISEPIDLGGREGEFFQVALDAFSFGGNLYAIPYFTEAVALYYNKDLVETAPATLEELTASCDELGDAIEACWTVPGGGDGPDAYHNYPFVSALGGYIFAYDSETGYDVNDVGLDSEGAVAGVSLLEQLTVDGYVANTNGDDAKTLFLDGSAPYFLSGPWQLNDFNTAGLNYGVATIPTIDGNQPAPFMGAGGMFVNAFSENVGLATAFLLDYVASQAFMDAVYEADPRSPAFQATFEAVVAGDEVAEAFALSASQGNPMPNVPEMASVWGPLGDQINGVRNGNTDAETAMTTAATQVREAIAG